MSSLICWSGLGEERLLWVACSVLVPQCEQMSLLYCVFLSLKALQLVSGHKSGLENDEVSFFFEDLHQQIEGQMSSLSLLFEASMPAFNFIVVTHGLDKDAPLGNTADSALHPGCVEVICQLSQPFICCLLSEILKGLLCVFN